jgi:hypothetical protein
MGIQGTTPLHTVVKVHVRGKLDQIGLNHEINFIKTQFEWEKLVIVK